MSVKKKLVFWSIVVMIIVVSVISGIYSYENKKDLVYRDSLDMTAVTVDGTILTLRDLAYYIAKEELEIEAQARVYEPENTKKYWGLRLQAGKFIKVEAKKIVIDAAIHDQIFYSMAIEQGITLDEEEKRRLELYQTDFWNDLDKEGQETLGVSEKDIQAVMYRIALAGKYQSMYTQEHTADQEAYDVGGELYKKLLKEHKYKVNRKNWKRVPFGNILVQNN